MALHITRITGLGIHVELFLGACELDRMFLNVSQSTVTRELGSIAPLSIE
jgi:hypothetical protein